MCATVNMFEKIEGYKKFAYCRHCNRRIQVKNLNQYMCEKCGYRGSMMSQENGVTSKQITPGMHKCTKTIK